MTTALAVLVALSGAVLWVGSKLEQPAPLLIFWGATLGMLLYLVLLATGGRGY